MIYREPKLGALLGAGFAATLLMTMLMYAAPAMGMPEMDVAAMLGSLLGGGTEASSGTWWLGMIWHFVNGAILFPLLFAYALAARLPGEPWFKGLAFGLGLWLLSQLIVMPALGMGLFSSAAPEPTLAVLGSALGHAVYGVALGALAGLEPVVRHQAVHHPR